MRDIFILYSLNPHTYQPVKERNNWGLSSNRYTCTHRTENKGNGLLFDFGVLIDYFFSSIFLPRFIRNVGFGGVGLYTAGLFLDGVGEEGIKPFSPSPPITCPQHKVRQHGTVMLRHDSQDCLS